MQEQNPWIVRPRVRPHAKMRLFCFPYAGVGPSAFRGWAEGVDSNLEACYIQMPGREGRLRERPYNSMRELIPPLIDSLTPLFDKPPLFYGHSLGAKIAFETCRELRRSGMGHPAQLFVGACPAPHLGREHPPMHQLEDAEFVDEIGRRYGGVPLEILRDPEILSLLLPAMRADVTLLETYEYLPEAPLECPITAFGGAQDRMVTEASITQWRKETSGRFQMNLLMGDHFITQSAKPALLRAISEEARLLISPP